MFCIFYGQQGRDRRVYFYFNYPVTGGEYLDRNGKEIDEKERERERETGREYKTECKYRNEQCYKLKRAQDP